MATAGYDLYRNSDTEETAPTAVRKQSTRNQKKQESDSDEDYQVTLAADDNDDVETQDVSSTSQEHEFLATALATFSQEPVEESEELPETQSLEDPPIPKITARIHVSRRKPSNPKRHLTGQKSPASRIIPIPADSKKPKRRFRPGTVALREIRKQQKSTERIIPALNFQRVVREVTGEVATISGHRWQKIAIDALQEAAEHFLVEMFANGQRNANHRNVITLCRKDYVKAVAEFEEANERHCKKSYLEPLLAKQHK